MRYARLIAGVLASGVLLSGCSRHPKVDFSIPTELTEPAPTEAAETQPMTFKPTEAPDPGYATADAAYQAYLDAVQTQDVEGFCAMFHPAEIEYSRSVPTKFLKNWFDIKQEADYKSYLTRTDPEGFRKMAMADFNSYQSAMGAFGEEGETWKLEAGETHIMEKDELQSFRNTLHVEFTRGTKRDKFCFVGESSGEVVEGKEVYLFCVDDRWYPSYTRECVPDVLKLSDMDPEYASEIARIKESREAAAAAAKSTEETE